MLQTLGHTEILTREGQTRICRNDGKFTRTDGGVMQLVYENWVGYHEQWHFTHRFENSMLAYVCSASSSERSHDYGAFILSLSSPSPTWPPSSWRRSKARCATSTTSNSAL